MTHVLTLAAEAYLVTVLLYALFLSYCTLRVMRDTGRLAAMPALARGHCWAILYFAFFLDCAFNVTLGSLIFLELPELRRLAFTARCAKWLGRGGYRSKVAHWVCEGWLNPGEPGHCS